MLMQQGRGAFGAPPLLVRASSEEFGCARIRSRGYYPAHERPACSPYTRPVGTDRTRARGRHLPAGPLRPRHRGVPDRRLRRAALVRRLRVAEQADLGQQLRHRARLDVPGHLPAVLPARRPARQVRARAEQPRRLDARQPHRRRHAPQVEGPARDGRHLAGLAVLRRRPRPGGRDRQHRQQGRGSLLRPAAHPGGPAAEAGVRQRGVGLQRPAREPDLRGGARD